ncbi:MAG: Holliday junction branch migration protein RuvA, partial [Candidatus Liptonbacteria bacterium]|nr:Holliday junction branch migration protein RuvA [Candidatus Liptonbacteria bacterium]
MIYNLFGTVLSKQDNFAVVDVHGVGFKVFASPRTLRGINGEVKLFTHLHVKEDAMDLYGFLSKEELVFFEQLISISGVGPKSALSVLEVEE